MGAARGPSTSSAPQLPGTNSSGGINAPTGTNTGTGKGGGNPTSGDIWGAAKSTIWNPFDPKTFGPKGGAPQTPDLQQGTTAADVQQAQQNAGNSMQAQQGLLSALQSQNGLGQQSALADQLSAANGIGTQNSAIAGLQGAAGQYQNIASGQGPNPAMAALHQATGQNIQNQAAMMAGQRGAGANAGLMARQAGQMGGNLQQQSVGQGATMQANQQLGALQGMVGAQQAVGGLGSTQAAQQQALANQVAGQQIGQVNANTQSALANQAAMQGSLGAYNQAQVGAQGSVNAGNVALAQQQMAGRQGLMGGVASGIGSALSFAGGGDVAPETEPIVNDANAGPASAPPSSGASSSFGKYLSSAQESQPSGTVGGNNDLGEIAELAAMFFNKGGLAKDGGNVKPKGESQKAVKSGDSYSNDKIPAKLSEGEIVLPRSVTMSDDPVRASADFVAKVIAKRKAKS